MSTKRSPRVLSVAWSARGGHGGLMSAAADGNQYIPPIRSPQIPDPDLSRNQKTNPFLVSVPASGKPLGILRKSAATVFTRWQMQRAAQRLLPEQQVSGCFRDVRDNGTTRQAVRVVRDDAGRARYRDLHVCGSVWACPICAARISSGRAEELQRGVQNHRDSGGAVLFITYTIPHQIHSPLNDLLGGLGRALSSMKAARGYKQVMSRLGSHGAVRAMEVTHGANGWHPHAHELIFIDLADHAEAAAIAEEIRSMWSAAVEKAGLGRVNQHGFEVRNGDFAAEYISKFGRDPKHGWKASDEIARAHAKRSSKKGRTPFQLLADYLAGDSQAGELFQHYARVFKGRRQLFYSRGLKEYLKLEDTSDEELAEAVPRVPEEQLAVLDEPAWRVVLSHNARGQVLKLADRWGQRGVDRLVRWLGKRPGIDSPHYKLRDGFKLRAVGGRRPPGSAEHYAELHVEWEEFFAA